MLVFVALLVVVLLLLGLFCYGQFGGFVVCLGGGGAAFPGSKYFVWSKLVVSLGGCSTGSCAAFHGSKLVGGVVEVEDLFCVDYVGGCGAAFPWG